MYLISRVFGCVANAHVPKEIRGKFDDKSEKCIFIGYREQSKAQKFYNLVTRKTIINKDVVFKEKESWNETVDETVDSRVPLIEEEDVAEKHKQ